ncbi:MAG: metal ABC transporter substrate-binding protein [Synechococcus sp.]
MKRPSTVGVPVVTGLLALLLAPAAAAATPIVIAGDGVLCDLTRTLSGGATDVRCLIAPGTDPHYYQLTPTNRRDISQSQVVLINGYGLTPTLARLNGSFDVVAVGEQAVPNNPSQDPHLWHSPTNTSAMAVVVSRTLQKLPVNAESKAGLQRREQTVTKILRDLDAWNRRQIATMPSSNRALVSEHLAFGFFTNRYGLKQVAMIDDYATGGQLRPSSLRRISDAVKVSNTKVLFAEQQPPSKTLRRISKRAGKPIASQILFADGNAPGKSLIATATTNTCTVVNAQGGSCDQAGAKTLQERWEAVR